MKLLTKEIERLLAKEDSRNESDPVAVVKFFTPWTYWTWYATDYDPVEKVFFGYVQGHENELGSFSLEELKSLKGPAGLRVERDLYFKPTRLSELGALV